MSGKNERDQQRNAADSTVAAIETEIGRIQALALDGARELWRKTFQKDVPKALTRDLLIRMICWHIQEQVFGGHDRTTVKILESYARGAPEGAQKLRRLKPGTELVREFQGERHTVVVTAQGFRWRGGDYSSLTAIARVITGTNWNGPRFFGLRVEGEGEAGSAIPSKTAGKPGLSRGAKTAPGRPA